ncbi:hypothetical protein ACH61_02875 [Rathayibacter tanaceti]|uniref:Uncharacterized protein n=2 Tax=Rathayibacter tanaceti TaxID=1671680 RepID=A0A166H657_9MICO|nr:hypothetical protein ACH61_02875 [Rathayibacter tanaceti]
MWRPVHPTPVGPEARDSLWSHPDLLPGSDDLDDPSALVARLTAEASGQSPEPDEMDRALEDLLNGTMPDATEGDSGDEGPDPTGDRPV